MARSSSSRPVLLASLVAFASGCAALGSAWEYVITERPPYPLQRVELTSDVWIDSSGVLLGSFVGSGNDARVTLLSSDTGFIAELVRRYRPELARGQRDVWSSLARVGVVNIPVEGMRGRRPGTELGSARVASPYGHSNVELEAVRLRGSSCGWRGARAEVEVSGPLRGSRAPSLRGPVVGSFRPGASSDAREWRTAPPRPSPALEADLIARTERDMDSVLAELLPRRSTPLGRPERQRLLVDPLEEVNAAEVLPLWAGQGRVRYAVAIRATRTTPRGEDLLASTVMIWDSAGLWRQSVTIPTVVRMERRGFQPFDPGMMPFYWQRLDAVSGFGLDRDYLVLEQVDVSTQAVYWAAIEGRSNNVVAAVEVGGACADDYYDDRGRGRGPDR